MGELIKKLIYLFLLAGLAQGCATSDKAKNGTAPTTEITIHLHATAYEMTEYTLDRRDNHVQIAISGQMVFEKSWLGPNYLEYTAKVRAGDILKIDWNTFRKGVSSVWITHEDKQVGPEAYSSMPDFENISFHWRIPASLFQ